MAKRKASVIANDEDVENIKPNKRSSSSDSQTLKATSKKPSNKRQKTSRTGDASSPQYQTNPSNLKVFVAISKIPNSGNGLFAKETIPKGELICTYGGTFIDNADAHYTDPTYLVNFENGRGYKLIGDNLDGDLGHYANAVHPDHPEVTQNARFNLTNKKYLPNLRGRFNIFAVEDIPAGEEIIVSYGKGYWLTMSKWHEMSTTGHLPQKSEAAQEREARAMKRLQRI
jgi:SET domain-containing protein